MRSLVYISIIVLSLLSSVVSAKHVLVTRTRIPKRSTPQKPRPDSVIITDEAIAERMILRKAMMAHGFKPISSEWWHFTLRDEPFPNTYFTFPVKQLR